MTLHEWTIVERLLTSTQSDHPGRTVVDAIYYLGDAVKDVNDELRYLRELMEKR